MNLFVDKACNVYYYKHINKTKEQKMKTYIGRFASNYDSTFEVVVLKRTEKSVTFIHPINKQKKRAKIHKYNNDEFFMPLGNHSMCPVITL